MKIVTCSLTEPATLMKGLITFLGWTYSVFDECCSTVPLLELWSDLICFYGKK